MEEMMENLVGKIVRTAPSASLQHVAGGDTNSARELQHIIDKLSGSQDDLPPSSLGLLHWFLSTLGLSVEQDDDLWTIKFPSSMPFKKIRFPKRLFFVSVVLGSLLSVLSGIFSFLVNSNSWKTDAVNLGLYLIMSGLVMYFFTSFFRPPSKSMVAARGRSRSLFKSPATQRVIAQVNQSRETGDLGKHLLDEESLDAETNRNSSKGSKHKLTARERSRFCYLEGEFDLRPTARKYGKWAGIFVICATLVFAIVASLQMFLKYMHDKDKLWALILSTVFRFLALSIYASIMFTGLCSFLCSALLLNKRFTFIARYIEWLDFSCAENGKGFLLEQKYLSSRRIMSSVNRAFLEVESFSTHFSFLIGGAVIILAPLVIIYLYTFTTNEASAFAKATEDDNESNASALWKEFEKTWYSFLILVFGLSFLSILLLGASSISGGCEQIKKRMKALYSTLLGMVHDMRIISALSEDELARIPSLWDSLVKSFAKEETRNRGLISKDDVEKEKQISFFYAQTVQGFQQSVFWLVQDTRGVTLFGIFVITPAILKSMFMGLGTVVTSLWAQHTKAGEGK